MPQVARGSAFFVRRIRVIKQIDIIINSFMETKPTETNKNTPPATTPEPTPAELKAAILNLEKRIAKLERERGGDGFGKVQH